MMLELELKDIGCEVIGPAPSVDEAIELIETEPFDCALLDYRLGHETSSAIAKALAHRHIPFLFMTGHGGNDLPSEFRRETLPEKPVTRKALRSAVEAILVSPNRAASECRSTVQDALVMNSPALRYFRLDFDGPSLDRKVRQCANFLGRSWHRSASVDRWTASGPKTRPWPRLRRRDRRAVEFEMMLLTFGLQGFGLVAVAPEPPIPSRGRGGSERDRNPLAL